MRHTLIILSLLSLLNIIGCAEAPTPGPVFGNAEVTVETVVPAKQVIMPNLLLTIDVAGQITEQACATNWKRYSCKASTSKQVRKGDIITVKVERALCVVDCGILEKIYTVDTAINLREVPVDTSEIQFAAEVHVNPT